MKLSDVRIIANVHSQSNCGVISTLGIIRQVDEIRRFLAAICCRLQNRRSAALAVSTSRRQCHMMKYEGTCLGLQPRAAKMLLKRTVVIQNIKFVQISYSVIWLSLYTRMSVKICARRSHLPLII